ncbi:MAG: TetR/AcrR family transcriptional regulator [Eubacteriales bacterium]|nr:TetR/AcrR family transcriptional regulator [Eubacteriales bacterium]
MNDKFFDLKQEKQDRIMNAALKVFARSSYKHASTDDIVKEAGISKGLLFHYFESKTGLYAFLYDYSVRFMLLELSREVDRSETDFFALTKQMEEARMQVMKLYPYMQQFLNVGLKEECQEAAEQIEERRSDYRERMRAYTMQADYSVFAGIGDSERMIRLVQYTIDGITAEMSARYDFTPEKLYQEICEYIDMLQRMMRR